MSRGPEVRDAMAEMAERAQAISQEAGTKIASAMRDVINTAAGIAGFAVESVRDLVQYMVRRGQMTQDEADRLIREAEDARGKRGSKSEARSATDASASKEPAPRSAPKTAKKAAAKTSAAASEKKPVAKKSTVPKKRR
jgi:polyhydroxyalkanoate synthesis regulator phasin